MEATIHCHELKSWQARHNSGEIYMTALAPTKNGYRLTYSETPGMSETFQAASSENNAGNNQGSAGAPPAHCEPPMRDDPQPETISPPVLIPCLDCETEHPEGQDCPICSAMARIAAKAREKRSSQCSTCETASNSTAGPTNPTESATRECASC